PPLLAVQVGARGLLNPEPGRRTDEDNVLGRSPELPGAELPARRRQGGGPRLLLQQRDRPAGDRGDDGGGAGRVSRPDGVRPEGPPFRPEKRSRRPHLVPRRRTIAAGVPAPRHAGATGGRQDDRRDDAPQARIPAV